MKTCLGIAVLGFFLCGGDACAVLEQSYGVQWLGEDPDAPLPPVFTPEGVETLFPDIHAIPAFMAPAEAKAPLLKVVEFPSTFHSLIPADLRTSSNPLRFALVMQAALPLAPTPPLLYVPNGMRMLSLSAAPSPDSDQTHQRWSTFSFENAGVAHTLVILHLLLNTHDAQYSEPLPELYPEQRLYPEVEVLKPFVLWMELRSLPNLVERFSDAEVYFKQCFAQTDQWRVDGFLRLLNVRRPNDEGRTLGRYNNLLAPLDPSDRLSLMTLLSKYLEPADRPPEHLSFLHQVLEESSDVPETIVLLNARDTHTETEFNNFIQRVTAYPLQRQSLLKTWGCVDQVAMHDLFTLLQGGEFFQDWSEVHPAVLEFLGMFQVANAPSTDDINRLKQGVVRRARLAQSLSSSNGEATPREARAAYFAKKIAAVQNLPTLWKTFPSLFVRSIQSFFVMTKLEEYGMAAEQVQRTWVDERLDEPSPSLSLQLLASYSAFEDTLLEGMRSFIANPYDTASLSFLLQCVFIDECARDGRDYLARVESEGRLALYTQALAAAEVHCDAHQIDIEARDRMRRNIMAAQSPIICAPYVIAEYLKMAWEHIEPQHPSSLEGEHFLAIPLYLRTPSDPRPLAVYLHPDFVHQVMNDYFSNVPFARGLDHFHQIFKSSFELALSSPDLLQSFFDGPCLGDGLCLNARMAHFVDWLTTNAAQNPGLNELTDGPVLLNATLLALYQGYPTGLSEQVVHEVLRSRLQGHITRQGPIDDTAIARAMQTFARSLSDPCLFGADDQVWLSDQG